jgi:vitamin B12 transporter
LYELYSDYGNQDLEAETSKTWDIGIERSFKKHGFNIGVTYFDMIFKDRIDYDFAISKYNQLPGDTKTKGIEISANWLPYDGINFMLNYTYTDTEDFEGKSIARRPQNKVSLNVKYDVSEKCHGIFDLLWVGERDAVSGAMDQDGNSVGVLDAYTLVNVAVNYDVSDDLQLYARIDNFWNEEYEEAWSYATPGFSMYMGFKLIY